MPTNEDLVRAALAIKDNCRKQDSCNPECAFYRKSEDALYGCSCLLTDESEEGCAPENWCVYPPRRFTDKEKELAKVYKGYGFHCIKRNIPSCCTALKYDPGHTEVVMACSLPEDAFTAIKIDESILIDDILKEE